MSAAATLVHELEAMGVELWVEGDRLRFRAPAGSLGPGQRALLAEHKADVLALLRGRAAQATQHAPLSWNQRALWFLQQDAPTSAAYNVGFAARIATAVDVGALRRALQVVMDRHAVLRTTFEVQDGLPQQRIRGWAPAALAEVDLTGQSEESLRAQVEADFRKPFDLEHGPVLRASLYTRGPGDHLLLLAAHHVSMDGWSVLILVGELMALYGEYTGGSPASLPAIAASYTDFDAWQQDLLASPRGAELWEFWKSNLAAPRATVELPTDFPRPPRKRYRGAAAGVSLDPELTAAVRAYARSEGTTPFVVLLAAFNALLFRYTGTEDLIVGTPTLGRPDDAFTRVIGDFAGVVPLRTAIAADLPFRELVRHVRETVLLALDGQAFPFPLMVERLQPGRDPSRSPLFEAVFALEGFGGATHRGAQDRPGADPLGLKLHRVEVRDAKFDVSMQLSEQLDHVEGAIEYNTDLYREETARQWAMHFIELVRAGISHPAVTIGDMPLTVPAPTGGDRTFAHVRTMHGRFEDQVLRRPAAVAVTCAGESVSYGELNARANRLAHHLRELGVGPGVLVGLLAERSIDLVTGVLAILKAGGAYLPIDPLYPRDRAAFMLRDGAAPVLLTQRNLASRLPGHDGITVYLDDDVSTCPDTNPPATVGADSLIYCIYTSGSTGQPKGTLLTQYAVERLFLATQDWFGFDDTDTWTLFHSIAFDFSVWEFWGALAHGGRLVIVPYMVSRSPDEFLQLLRAEQVTVLNQTPSAFRALIQADLDAGPPVPTALRHVIFGGEALEPRSLRPWVDRYGDSPRLVNMYGITETCVHVTYRVLTRAEVVEGAPSLIGGPIPDLRLEVLDPRGHGVPAGVPGELHVGGPGLARGYLNRPELSAQRFIPDPARPGERLYRTGDLVRRLHDGDLEYLGRIDHQVKLRGFRIELGEIEALLAQEPGVENQVVLARGHGDDARLVAWVVAHAGAHHGLADALRARLRAQLPEYMVPSSVMVLDAFPLTANGKLDRAGLREPEQRRTPPGAQARLRTPTEAAIADIWRDLLGVEEVWRTDDFFGLGGHSLVATRVVSRIREVFQLQLPLATLFEASRLQDLAAQVDEALRRGHHVAEVPPVTAHPPRDEEPLSFSQQRMWIIDSLARNTAYNIPACSWLDGPLDVAVLQRAVDRVVTRHEPLRSAYMLDGLQPVSRVILDVPRIALTDVSAGGDAAALEAAAGLAGDLFDLELGPVLRVALFRAAPERHLFVMCMHHIAGDNWSLGIIGHEIGACYNAFKRGEEPSLPELSVRYADYAQWQRTWLQGEALDQHLAYWKERLDGLVPLDLPTDRPRPALQTFNGSLLVEPLPHGLVERLERLGHDEGSTLFMAMAAAFVTLLQRYSGQGDIAIAVPIANRTTAAVENLVGTFVNTLVLRVDAGDNPTFRDLLGRVRTAALEAFAHQDVSFELLVEQLQARRDASRPPLTGVLFNVLNTPMPPFELEGLSWSAAAIDRGAAQFDMTLSVENSVLHSMLLEYNTNLYTGDTVRRFIGHYLQVLTETLANPGVRIGEIDLLAGGEREQVAAWNATESAYPRDTVLSRLFEARAAARSDAVAVSVKGECLTYADLNLRANQLAHHLVRRGVGQGSMIGIALHRTPAMLVALLAVQKAGATYLPLDPGFPPERLAYMLEDSGATVLLSEGDVLTGLDVPQGVEVLDLPGLEAELARESADNLDTCASPEDAAYIIYTSGSTGRPKGVAVSHGALVNFLWSMRREPGLAEDDALAAVTTLSFDIAGLELYLPLLVGARIELVPREEAADGTALAARLEACGATVMQATPATWRMLVEAGWRGRPGFRALCGGEAITRDLATALTERVAELWNMYGPTETTIWSTCELVDPDDITIGKPIANTVVHILDRHGQGAPIGIPGEICIGGDGVAIGYHQRPELTAEKFVPDPTGRPGRIYRTGDLGRWRADGRLECLGRLDQQVKVRGYRIEPGEIEALLATHPAIRTVSVVAREAAPGDARLVAYVVYHPGESPTVSELRRFLRKELPDYMIPAMVVPLDALPLTANGKVDRKALPDPYRMAIHRDAEPVPPTAGMERHLADVWQEVLQLPAVGAEDNFFELGGHSLLALRATSLFEKRTGMRIDPRAFFFQSLRQIAAGLPSRAGAGA